MPKKTFRLFDPRNAKWLFKGDFFFFFFEENNKGKFKVEDCWSE